MIYYGTNNTENGYEFMASVSSTEELNALLKGRYFTFFYYSDDAEPAPEWTKFPMAM